MSKFEKISVSTNYEATQSGVMTIIAKNIATEFVCNGNNYVGETPKIERCRIPALPKTVKGMQVDVGELVVELRHSPEKVLVQINEMGELVITAPDAEKYYINDAGELEYDQCFELILLESFKPVLTERGNIIYQEPL